MNHLRLLLLISLLLTACATPRTSLRHRIEEAIEGHDARIGVAVLTPEGQTVVCGDTPLPMMSIFKFPVALAVLDKAVATHTPFATPVHVGSEWLDPQTYSPLRDSLPPGGGWVSLENLLRYSVSKSDNIACDLLLDFLGGPTAADDYVRAQGIDGIRIVATERTMHLAIENQRLNTARPAAVCKLFGRFLRGESLPAQQTLFLRELLEHATTGSGKLRAGLPAGTTLGHKTGSSDRMPDGVRIADNDAGYVLLPDGRSYCIAVLVTDSREDDATNAAVIAKLSKIAYDYFTKNR